MNAEDEYFSSTRRHTVIDQFFNLPLLKALRIFISYLGLENEENTKEIIHTTVMLLYLFFYISQFILMLKFLL